MTSEPSTGAIVNNNGPLATTKPKSLVFSVKTLSSSGSIQGLVFFVQKLCFQNNLPLSVS